MATNSNGGGGGKAAPFKRIESLPQPKYNFASDPELGGASGEPGGGRVPHADAKPGSGGGDIGAGSIGNGNKPFRVGGG